MFEYPPYLLNSCPFNIQNCEIRIRSVLTFPSYSLTTKFFSVLYVPHYNKALFNVTPDSIIWRKAFWWLSIKYFIPFQKYWLFPYEQSFLHLVMDFFRYQGAKLNSWAYHIQNYTVVYSASLHKTWKLLCAMSHITDCSAGKRMCSSAGSGEVILQLALLLTHEQV